MHVDHREEHVVGVIHDDDYGGSCCTTIFSNLVEDMGN